MLKSFVSRDDSSEEEWDLEDMVVLWLYCQVSKGGGAYKLVKHRYLASQTQLPYKVVKHRYISR